MTDSILRSYYNVSSSTFVPFAVTVPPFASDLLVGETDGFAVDSTTYDNATAAAYVGGPVGGTVAIIDTGTPANDRDDVPMDTALLNASTSPKMTLTSAGLLRWSPHNYVIQSQTFTTGWTTERCNLTSNTAVAPDGTTTADSFIEDSTAGFHDFYNAATVTLDITGSLVTGSIYAKIASGTRGIRVGVYSGSFGLSFAAEFDVIGVSVGTTTGAGYVSSSITSAGSGWYRLAVTGYQQGVADAFLNCYLISGGTVSYTGDGTSSFYIWGAQINRGYVATPYLVTTSAQRFGVSQSYDTAGGRYGILTEPSTTNSWRKSQDLDETGEWGGVDFVVTSDVTTAPDGSSTADLVTFGSNASASLGGYPGMANNTLYNASCYVKPSTSATWLRMVHFDTGTTHGARAWFNIATVAVGTTSTFGTGVIGTTTITAIGSGWYRIAMMATSQNSGNFGYIDFALVTADGGSTRETNAAFYLWGCQQEPVSTSGNQVTSYIPVWAASVTRAVDNNYALTTTFPYSDTATTLIVWWKPIASVSTGAVISMDDGSGSERMKITAATLSPRNWYVVSGGVGQADILGGSWTAGVAAKDAGTSTTNDTEMVGDGVPLGTPDLIVTQPTGLDVISFGNAHYAPTTFFNHCYVYQGTYLKRRVSQAQMITKTS